MRTHKNHVHTHYCKHSSIQAIAKNMCSRTILHNITTHVSMYAECVFHPSNVQYAYKMIIQHINPPLLKSNPILIILANNGPHLMLIYSTCNGIVYF